jgi:hypothetical protein
MVTALTDTISAGNLRSGVNKLFKQIEFTNERIKEAHASLVFHLPQWDFKTADRMTLDVETYYTLARKLLRLATRLLPETERQKFKAERVFKRITVIRNRLVEHAYDTGNRENDPYAGYGWSAVHGVHVKAGSSMRSSTDVDPGFFVNQHAVDELLNKYEVRALAGLTPRSGFCP